MNSDGEAALQSPRKPLNVTNDQIAITSRLYRSLEDVAYIQCAILFYTDQSLAFAIARWNLINNYTSADAIARLRIPVSIIVNVGCALWHLLAAAPVPVNNELRGYMSGATLVDMVGEFPPSKLRLLVLDLLFILVQVSMMIVSHQHKKAEIKKKAPVRADPERQRQDIDAEEQGIQRNQEIEEAESAALLVDEAGDDTSEITPPILKIDIMGSMKEISDYRDVDDPDLASQRMESRARVRRLLTTLAQRVTRD